MRLILIILFGLYNASAYADCTSWAFDLHGNKVCVADDLVNRNPTFSLPPFIMATPESKCEEGWILLVYHDTLNAVCAKELKQPIR